MRRVNFYRITIRAPLQSPSLLSQMGPSSHVHVPLHASPIPESNIGFPLSSEIPCTASFYKSLTRHKI